MKTFTLILLLVLLPCAAQTTSYETSHDRTLGRANGRLWQSLSNASKVLFLMGFQEGYSVAIVTNATTAQLREQLQQQEFYLPSTMSYGEIVKGMDPVLSGA